jgi:hypothetical protein
MSITRSMRRPGSSGRESGETRQRAPARPVFGSAATRVLLRRRFLAPARFRTSVGDMSIGPGRGCSSDVRGEAVRRDVFAAEPTEGLAGRDVDALHCITSIGDCRLDVKRERPLHPGRQLGRVAAQEPNSGNGFEPIDFEYRRSGDRSRPWSFAFSPYAPSSRAPSGLYCFCAFAAAFTR